MDRLTQIDQTAKKWKGVQSIGCLGVISLLSYVVIIPTIGFVLGFFGVGPPIW